MKENQKLDQASKYAVLVYGQLWEMLGNDECTNRVPLQELVDDPDKLKDFVHAFATMAPGMLFNKITGDSKNHLEFNQLANTLCCEYMVKEKE